MMKKVGQLYLVRHSFNVDNLNAHRVAVTHRFLEGRLYMLTRLPDPTHSSTFFTWRFLNNRTEVAVRISNPDFDYYFEENPCL